MSSRSDVLLGCQKPRIEILPAGSDWSEADDAAFLSGSYGLEPEEWQLPCLVAWLSRRKDGKWASSTCGLTVPRQNGKNGVLEMRELYGMVVLGEKFLHTAHEVKTARKHFNRFVSFFENDDYPELKALVVEIRKANGQEAIVLSNGGSLEMVARSKGAGRGFTVDVLVFDEAQELSDEALEALKPTLSSAPLRNPQTIFTGTPPSEKMAGEVFTRTRKSLIDGLVSRGCWHEWSIPADTDDVKVDLDDRQVWAAVNPALGGRLNLETIEDERTQFSDEGFARERLGRWSEESHAMVVKPSVWGRRKVVESPVGGKLAYAADMNPDRTMIAIGVATIDPDSDCVHVECVEHRSAHSGTDWVVEWLASRWDKASAVVIDAQSPIASIVPALTRRGVRVTVTGSTEMARACGDFLDLVNTKDGMSHFDQPQLNAALAGAKKRPIGAAGAFGWDRKSLDMDITPLVVVTLASFGVKTSKRKPGRKSKVSF